MFLCKNESTQHSLNIFPGEPNALQQQGLRRPVRLLEVRHLGHHRSSGLPQRAQRLNPHRDRHHVLHHHPQKDPLLHRQLDSPDRAHFLPLRLGLLFARRGRRKGDVGHQHFALTRRLPAARIKDLAANVARVAAHRQVLALHLHHEHRLHLGHRRHHQLELQGTQNPLNAELDKSSLPQISANFSFHEKTQKDAT